FVEPLWHLWRMQLSDKDLRHMHKYRGEIFTHNGRSPSKPPPHSQVFTPQGMGVLKFNGVALLSTRVLLYDHNSIAKKAAKWNKNYKRTEPLRFKSPYNLRRSNFGQMSG
ncbi:hypothetical protein GOP47_0017160, partial [Adiantum capillus-veneris]